MRGLLGGGFGASQHGSVKDGAKCAARASIGNGRILAMQEWAYTGNGRILPVMEWAYTGNGRILAMQEWAYTRQPGAVSMRICARLPSGCVTCVFVAAIGHGF